MPVQIQIHKYTNTQIHKYTICLKRLASKNCSRLPCQDFCICFLYLYVDCICVLTETWRYQANGNAAQETQPWMSQRSKIRRRDAEGQDIAYLVVLDASKAVSGANNCAVSQLPPQILPLVEVRRGNFPKMSKLSALLPLLLPLTEGQGRNTGKPLIHRFQVSVKRRQEATFQELEVDPGRTPRC